MSSKLWQYIPMDWTDRIGIRLKLRDLHILLAVVEWGSMAKAARHLAVSQPVVSRAIAELEQELGVRLLDRTPQGVVPTVYGRTVLNRGLAVFDELRGSVEDIRFLSDPTAGELRIGSTQAVAGGLLAAILDRLTAQRPRIAFHVKLGDAAMLHYHELRERNVDLLFGRVVELKEDDVNAEVLFEDRLYVVAGADNPWTRRRKVSLKDLVHEPWTLPPTDSYVGGLITEAFRASGLALPHINVASYGMQLQGGLLGTGHFLSILPGSFLSVSGKALGFKALPIELPIPPRPIGIVTLKDRTLSPLAALFIDCARTLSKALAAMTVARK
jgi:DNA-binding transcriptional LysR family regulator